MTEHQPRNAFDIPKLFYFQAGNLHTGSKKALRYRICPKENTLQVAIWHTDLCYELAAQQLADEAAFPLTEDGFEEMLTWLTAAYEALPAT